MKKAFTLREVDSAVRFDIPVSPKDGFFVDFNEVRGDFEERLVYKSLNVHPQNFDYNITANRFNKTLLFFGGMRGSGKTSEISKYVQNMDNPECFFCITCNIDQELDTNNVEYMDILIFQLEKLVERAQNKGITLKSDIIESLQNWFSHRISEINKSLKKETGLEIKIEAKTPGLLSNILSIAANLKAGITGSHQSAEIIRNTFKHNFVDFALKFNEFIEEMNRELRHRNVAKEILFVVDGIEKTMSAETRRKVIVDEANRLRQIKVNTIFTLPIELMKEQQKLKMFSTVISFPFVKIVEKDGSIIETAVTKFEEFVHKRIDAKLFDSQATVREAIKMSGGSPRELLRILEYANLYADENRNQITLADLQKAIKKLSAECSQYISSADLERLKVLKTNNEKGLLTPFDEGWQEMLENLLVFEYNNGTYKRVHPIVEASDIYKQYVI